MYAHSRKHLVSSRKPAKTQILTVHISDYQTTAPKTSAAIQLAALKSAYGKALAALCNGRNKTLVRPEMPKSFGYAQLFEGFRFGAVWLQLQVTLFSCPREYVNHHGGTMDP